MAGNIKEFTDGNWKSEVVESPIPVVVDFFAPGAALQDRGADGRKAGR